MTFMTLLDETLSALSRYTETVTGTRPSKTAFKLSRTNQLSLNSFVRADAEAAAAAMRSRKAECVLWGTEPILDVRAVNGWLLFDLSPAFFEVLCEKAAALEREPGTDYVSLRMTILMRKPACPCPDNARVHAALLRSVFANDRGTFTAEDDRAILTMTHGETGMHRIALENACGTLARALLMLRAPAVFGDHA